MKKLSITLIGCLILVGALFSVVVPPANSQLVMPGSTTVQQHSFLPVPTLTDEATDPGQNIDVAAFRHEVDQSAIFVWLVIFPMAVFLLRAVSGSNMKCLPWQVAVACLLSLTACLILPALGLLASGKMVNLQGEQFGCGLLMAIGSVMAGCGGRSLHHCQLLRNTPLSHVRNAAVGFLKLKGIADAIGSPAHTGFGLDALYFKEATYEYRRRETRQWDEKKKEYVTRVVYEWSLVHTAHGSVPCVLSDDTGSVGINPGEADTNPREVALFYNGRLVSNWRSQGQIGDRQTRIDYISPGAGLTVWGFYSARGSGMKTGAIGKDPLSNLFVIVEGSESLVFFKYGGLGALLALAGVMSLTTASVMMLASGCMRFFF